MGVEPKVDRRGFDWPPPGYAWGHADLMTWWRTGELPKGVIGVPWVKGKSLANRYAQEGASYSDEKIETEIREIRDESSRHMEEEWSEGETTCS